MPAQLRRLCRGLDTTETIDIRDRAMILLQFACGWRSAEVVSLDLANVRFTSAGLAVTLGASKTDQDGSEGRYVGLPKGQHELTCPVRALRAWVNVRGSEEGPLFCRINFPSGRVFAHRRLHPKVVRARLQLALEKIGEPANAYGSHSLRSGMVTTCIERGESELAIIQRTGHKNLETLKKYVRPAQAFRRDLLAGVL